MSAIKDTLKLARKWQEAGIERERAEQMVSALNDELKRGDLATKGDLAELKASLIQWMATLLITQVGVLFALLKFFPS